MQQHEWQYDEMRQVGTDYFDPAEAAKWDSKRATLGDVEAEMRRAIAQLHLRPEDTLIDLGAGTGTFAVAAAGVENIEYHQAGFLTYEHEGKPVDAVTSMAALHHLPDAWKQVGLLRMAGLLRTGGRLLLRDVVFTFQPAAYREAFEGMASVMAQRGGDDLAAAMCRHIRDEFSTFDWVIDHAIRQY